jgi:hypothetical protein
MMDMLADEIGVRAQLTDYVLRGDLLFAAQLFFGPVYPYTYRLRGPHAWRDARAAIVDARRRVVMPLQSNGSSVEKRVPVGLDKNGVSAPRRPHTQYRAPSSTSCTHTASTFWRVRRLCTPRAHSTVMPSQ